MSFKAQFSVRFLAFIQGAILEQLGFYASLNVTYENELRKSQQLRQ